MKKLITAFATGAALLAMFSCKTDEGEKSFLNVSENRLEFSADGETKSFIVETGSDTQWNITTDGQTWYTVVPESGTGNAKIEVTAEVWIGENSREAALTVNADRIEEEIRIQQFSPVEPTHVTFYSLTEAEQASIGMLNSRVTAVSGNGKWAVAVDEDMGHQAMLWSYETREFTDLNDGSSSECHAKDVSNDGLVVGGSGYYSDGVWEAFPDEGSPVFISDDGHVVVGSIMEQLPEKSIPIPSLAVWIDYVMQPELENLPRENVGQYTMMALGMSEDGTVIAGKTEWGNGMVSPAVYANGNLIRIYGESPEAEWFYFGEATSVSKDGTKVVGYFMEDGQSVSNNFMYDIPSGTLTEIPVNLPSFIGYDGTVYGANRLMTPEGEVLYYADYIDRYVSEDSTAEGFKYPYIVLSVSDNGKVWGGYYTVTEGFGVTFMVPGIWVFE